jgi:hypothetical protein
VAIDWSPATPAPITNTRAGGRHRSGGGREHREELREPIRGHEHGLVAGDRRLGGQHVHALRTRDPWDQLHREHGDAAGGELGEITARRQRLPHTDDDLTLAVTIQIRAPGIRVRADRAHLEQQFGVEDLVPAPDGGAVLDERHVLVPGTITGPGLHHDLHPGRL